MSAVNIVKTLARFDLCSTTKEWQVKMGPLPNGLDWISAMWDEEDEPSVEDLAPSEVAELIAERRARLWYDSQKDWLAACLSYIREHAEAIDHEWALAKSGRLTRTAQQMMEEAAILLKRHPAPAAEEAPHG